MIKTYLPSIWQKRATARFISGTASRVGNLALMCLKSKIWGGGGGGGGPTILKYIKVYPRVKIGKNPTF